MILAKLVQVSLQEFGPCVHGAQKRPQLRIRLLAQFERQDADEIRASIRRRHERVFYQHVRGLLGMKDVRLFKRRV